MLAPWCSAELRRAGQVYLPTCKQAKIGRVGEVSCDAVGAEGETLQGEKDVAREGKMEWKERQKQKCSPFPMRWGPVALPCGASAAGWACAPHTGVPLLPHVLKQVRRPCLGSVLRLHGPTRPCLAPPAPQCWLRRPEAAWRLQWKLGDCNH